MHKAFAMVNKMASWLRGWESENTRPPKKISNLSEVWILNKVQLFLNQSIFFLLNCEGPEFTHSVPVKAALMAFTHGKRCIPHGSTPFTRIEWSKKISNFSEVWILKKKKKRIADGGTRTLVLLILTDSGAVLWTADIFFISFFCLMWGCACIWYFLKHRWFGYCLFISRIISRLFISRILKKIFFGLIIS